MNNIYKVGFALGLAGLAVLNLPAQTPRHVCGTDELHEILMRDERYRGNVERFEADYQEWVTAGRPGRDAVRKIPVVVHVMQSSDVEVLPDAEIYSQLEVLNEDFRKMAGTLGFGNGVDTEYEFCLASIDPNGCPTTGINRVAAGKWAYHEQADAAILKGMIQWDPYKYFNIWVPRTIETQISGGQVLGYATFPANLPSFSHLDGVVIHSSYFGRNSDLTYRGRTLTHEAGHWTGLYHTFQGACTGATANTCTSQGDRVCDTPQAFEANFGCPAPTTVNSCTDAPVNNPDLTENYMDYSDGVCQNMFTQGQKDRMDFYFNGIRSQIWSAANLTATGCDGTTAACAPTAEFEANNLVVCVGQPVTFTDMSTQNPTGWTWTFNGGTPATSTAQNPTITYSTPGSYDVVLVSNNGTGNSPVETKFAYIEVVEPTTTGLVQGFEGILNLPALWYTTGDNGPENWKLTSAARSEGQNSMKVKNFEARNYDESINLYSNPFTLSNMISGYMTFDHSYKKLSGLTQEGLKVHVSTDCGATWTEVWSKVGPYLATVAGTQSTTEWVPTQAAHWVSDTVSLDSFAGEPNVKVRFEVKSQGGQSIYLDNINMNLTLVNRADPSQLDLGFQVSPNPFRDEMRVQYSLQRAGEVTFTLTDITGKAVGTVGTGMQSAGMHNLTIGPAQLRALPSGIYFLKGTTANGTVTRKVVKMH